MKTTYAIAPPWSVLRPAKGAPAPGAKIRDFPVHVALEETLATAAPPEEPHAVARHVCAVLAAWSYSDADTVAMIMARLGLNDCRVRCVELSNNAMIIRSTAFLVQSVDGRVVLLAYRGTDPFDFSTWAVDADINQPALLTSGNVRAGGGRGLVHAGFYRNQRATWYEVVAALKRALRGESILEDGEGAAPPRQPLEALYVTGHSLGAAMATIAAYKLAEDDDYTDLERVLKQVYLFAPPMVGDPGFKQLWNGVTLADGGTLDARVFAHTYARDVVPCVPPHGATRYVHVGKHYASRAAEGGGPPAWGPAEAPRQCSVLDMVHAVEPVIFGHITLRVLLPLVGPVIGKVMDTISPRALSFADHVPTNYVLCSQPAGVNTEFGDDF